MEASWIIFRGSHFWLVCLVILLEYNSSSLGLYVTNLCRPYFDGASNREVFVPPQRYHSRYVGQSENIFRFTDHSKRKLDFSLGQDSIDERVPSISEISDNLNSNCGSRKTGYISGGRTAEPGEFPSYVSVVIHDGMIGVSQCGGTILSDRYVLTAGHCVVNNVKDAYVKPSRENPYPRYNFNKMLKVKRICISRDYNRADLRYDIAILKLSEPIKFNETVQPACLPNKPIDNQVQAYAIGLGITTNEVSSGPKFLQVLPVKQKQCKGLYPPKNHICFGSNQRQHVGDTCLGDSGGPIIATQDGKETVFGVTSHGEKICAKGVPNLSVNMNTYVLRDEILEVIKECYRGREDRGVVWNEE